MGLFNAFRNKKSNAPGFDAITNKCEEVYPGQTDPKRYGTIISWEMGGKDPLKSIAIYDGGEYWHFVTYGLSDLYKKTTKNKDLSGYGMEFTLKLKKLKSENEELEIKCICGVLQHIARITFEQGEIFKPNEYIYTGQKEGIDYNSKSNITGFITKLDDKLGEIDTINGKVIFVEFTGVTDKELKQILDNKLTVKELYEKLGTDITSYNRETVV